MYVGVYTPSCLCVGAHGATRRHTASHGDAHGALHTAHAPHGAARRCTRRCTRRTRPAACIFPRGDSSRDTHIPIPAAIKRNTRMTIIKQRLTAAHSVASDDPLPTETSLSSPLLDPVPPYL
eukprot:gene10256-biopygen7424